MQNYGTEKMQGANVGKTYQDSVMQFAPEKLTLLDFLFCFHQALLEFSILSLLLGTVNFLL
jgi:hypothetical protein